MQRLDFRQLSRWFHLRKLQRNYQNQNVCHLNKWSYPSVIHTVHTYILITANFFESAVLFNEWSSVFLPLRSQVHHPIGTGLNESLREEHRGFHWIWRPCWVWLNDRSQSFLLPGASPGCSQRLATGELFSSSTVSFPVPHRFPALAASAHPTPKPKYMTGAD